MARAALVAACAIGIGSAASAQVTIPTPSTPDYKLLKPLFTEAEVLAGVSGTASKAVRWGRVLPVVGTISLVSTAIFAGLDWYYQQAQQATGTPLDNWYQGLPPGAVSPAEPLSNCTSVGMLCRPANAGALAQYSISIGARPGNSVCGYLNGCTVGGVWSTFQSGVAVAEITPYGSSSQIGSYELQLDGCATAAACRTLLFTAMVDLWAEFIGDLYASEGGGGSLADHLAANPSSLAALADEVLPGWMSDRENQSWWPYTYAEPYGSGAGIEFDPAPNINEWYDNPYANPQVDSDGDGWPDWQEVEAGTDPKNPNSYPTVTPDPYQDSDGDGWTDHEERQAGTDPYDDQDYPAGTPNPQPKPDVDGDGIADELDPCPFDVLNRCVDGDDLPEDIATETTLQAVATAAQRTADATEAIADALTETIPEQVDGDWEQMVEPWPTPDTSALSAWAPDTTAARAALDAVVVDVETELDGVMAAAEGKFPFGMFTLIADVPAYTGAGDCVSVPLGIMGNSENVNLCDTPLDGYLQNTVRPLLIALLTFGLAWAVVRVVTSS